MPLSTHTHTHITQRYSTDIDTHNAIKCCRRRHTNNFYKWNKSPGPAESAAAQPAKSSGATHTHTQKKRAMSCACERALAHMHMRTEQDLSIRGARVQIVRARARVRAFAQHSSPFRPYASPPARSPVDERKSKSVFPMNNLTAQTAASGGRMMSAIRSNTPRTTNKHRHTQKKRCPPLPPCGRVAACRSLKSSECILVAAPAPRPQPPKKGPGPSPGFQT